MREEEEARTHKIVVLYKEVKYLQERTRNKQITRYRQAIEFKS